MANTSSRPDQTRRTILKVGGTVAIAGLASSGNAIAQTDLPVEIAQHAVDEYVVIRNVGDDEIDLTSYQINFEAGEDSNEDQIRTLAGEVTVAAGEEIIVPTGVNEVSGDNVVELDDPYETERLNNEDPDVVALLDPEGNVVVQSDERIDDDDGVDDGTDDGDDEEPPEDDEDEEPPADDQEDTDEDDAEDEEPADDDEDEKADDEDEEPADEKDKKKDGDDDGVAASEDADDDCPKRQ